ncbi:hypothetical protein AAF712_002029 [Marasmius tenuissimus]|uniref:RING-type domain-containing protein n=1 Tax=Marasmius tenuissimus TaxID=585030 RepID=A0ABR3AB71_9AGAR
MSDNELTITDFINSLSLLKPHQLSEDDFCPICFIPFADILNEQSTSKASIIGITKLESCGHIFCMKDLVEWIRGMHGNCPTCRHIFLDIRPPSDSDDESSDGGEYVPNPDEDDDESIYNYDIDTDPLTDADDQGSVDTDGMDLDGYNTWEGDMGPLEDDLGNDTDGDSSAIHSEEAFGEVLQTDDGSVSIHEDEVLEEGGVLEEIQVDDHEQK